MKKVLALILALIMVFGLMACGQKEPAPEAAPEVAPEAAPEVTPEAAPEEGTEEINYLRSQWAPINDTFSGFHHPSRVPNYIHTDMIWDTLIDFDVDAQKYVNTLAEDYTYSDDFTVWTITLKDANWHDGAPVVAEDVLMTYNMYVKVGAGEATKLAGLKGYDAFVNGEAETLAGMTAKDDKTIVFEFETPFAGFESVLAHNGFSILPSHLLGDLPYADATIDPDYWAKPIGTGPYMVNETDYPNYVTLTRNDNYHGAKAGIKDILLLIVQDTNARATSLLAGNVHFDGGTVDTIRTLVDTNPDYQIIYNDANYHQFFLINQGELGDARDDLKNVKIRKALSSYFDKEAIVDFMGDNYKLATTLSGGADYNTSIPQWTRANVEDVKKVLEEEGFDFSKPLRFYCPYSDQVYYDMLEIVRSNLADLGIEMEITPGSGDVFADYYTLVNWDFAVSGISGVGPAPYGDILTGGFADVWYNAADFETRKAHTTDLAAQYNAVLDLDERKAIIDEMQVHLLEDAFCCPMYSSMEVMAQHKDFTGKIDYGAYQAIAYKDFSNWSLAE